MDWFFILGAVLLIINLSIGIDDIKVGKATTGAALTWLAVGILTLDLIQQISHMV